MALIEGARRRLDLELFVLTDAGIVHALDSAAIRGVADTSTELTGRPAISLSEAVAPDLTDIST